MTNLIAKIFGWILLIVGVVIIGWTLYSSYNIFTGKTPVPELFTIEAEENQAPMKEKIPTSPAEIQEQIGKILGEQLTGILPTDVLPKMLNLGAWAMLAGLLIFGGSQLAGLGIKLIKK